MLYWHYLTAVFCHFGFGSSFLQWISALYDSPQAKVKYYGFESSPFPIRRGTQQGCPLSPILFVLAMEPLAEAIQSHPDITGVEIAGLPHKVSLFADDILLTLTNPRITVPNLFSLLDSFASFSGLSVNPNKSQAMSINLPPSDLTLKNTFTFQWLTSLSYLGNPAHLNLCGTLSGKLPPPHLEN